jgi:LemA protein
MSIRQWIGLAIAAVLLCWMVGAFTRLKQLRQEIHRSFDPLQAKLYHRHELLMQWVKLSLPTEPASSMNSAFDAVQGACAQVVAACKNVAHQPSLLQAVAALRLAEETLGVARERWMVHLYQLEPVLSVPAATPLALSAERAKPGASPKRMRSAKPPIKRSPYPWRGAEFDALHEADSAVLFARQHYNAVTQRYNEAVLEFPTWMIAGMFRFRVAGTF